MSSWAQQREAIRRAAQGGVRARTNAQGSQRLPLANNRLREVLLSRPNGELTRAGQFYYGLVGGRPPSRQFDEEQPLIREGPTDYILLRSGLKKPVRSLQPDGSYHLTKLGKAFFREKYTDWLAHVPVRITGTRQRGRNAGRPYQRDDFLPITVVNGSLSRQSSGLSDQQAHARVKEAALRQLDSPNDGDPILDLSQEVYRYDATHNWAFSKQTLEVVDNRAQVQVALRQPMGALREISYQLYNGSEILPSAFEVRNDQLCVATASGQGEPGRGLHVLPGARLLLQVGPGGLPLRRHPAQRGPLPRRPEGNHGAALLRVAPLGRPRRVGPLLGRGPAQRPRRAAGPGPPAQGDHALPVRLAGPAPPRPGRPRLRRHAVRRGRRNPPGLDAEAGPGVPGPAPGGRRRRGLPAPPQGEAPGSAGQPGPDPGGAELPVQALLRLHRAGQLRVRSRRPRAPGPGGPAPGAAGPVPGVPPDQDAPKSSRAACLESRVCRSVHEAYVQSPRPPALVCKLAKCDPDRICHGVDVVRCRNALANATFPLPVFSPLDSVEVSRDGHLADLTYVELHRDDRQALLRKLPYLGRGWYSKPAAAYCWRRARRPGPTSSGPWTPWSHGAWPRPWRSWRTPGRRARSTWPSFRSTPSSNQDLVYSMRTSNHELDGQDCQWRQTFTDAAGKVHWDHIYATELFSNYTLRPLHDYVMAQEHVAVAKIRDHLRKVPPRYVVALKTDCLVFQDLPKKFLPAVRELTAWKHQDGTPVYRFEECKRLEGEYREPRIEAPYLTCYGPEWRSVEDPLLHCLNGKSLLLSRACPAPGRRTWRARSWRSSASSGRWSSSSPRPTAPCRTWAPERRRRTASSAGASATGAASWTGSSSRRSRSWTPASGPTSRSCP